MEDFNRQFIEKINSLCVDAINNGDNKVEYHAVVMLYGKLCEMELGLGLAKQTIDGLVRQIQTPTNVNYETMVGEHDGQEAEID